MKIGFNMLLWTTEVEDQHFYLFNDLKSAGYDGVEIPIFQGNIENYIKINSRLAEIGLRATAVGIIPGPELSPISPDKTTRAKALDHLKWLVDCSDALGAEVLCGPFHSPLGVFSGKGPTHDEIKWCADVHRDVADYASSTPLLLSVEPLNRFECYFLNTAEAAERLVSYVSRPNYGYLWDSFHFNIEEKDLARSIDATFSAINHVHISENDRGTPGRGHIDFDSIFQSLIRRNYEGWLTIEAFGSALPDLAAATKVWRPLFSVEREVYTEGIAMIKKELQT